MNPILFLILSILFPPLVAWKFIREYRHFRYFRDSSIAWGRRDSLIFACKMMRYHYGYSVLASWDMAWPRARSLIRQNAREALAWLNFFDFIPSYIRQFWQTYRGDRLSHDRGYAMSTAFVFTMTDIAQEWARTANRPQFSSWVVNRPPSLVWGNSRPASPDWDTFDYKPTHFDELAMRDGCRALEAIANFPPGDPSWLDHAPSLSQRVAHHQV